MKKNLSQDQKLTEKVCPTCKLSLPYSPIEDPLALLPPSESAQEPSHDQTQHSFERPIALQHEPSSNTPDLQTSQSRVNPVSSTVTPANDEMQMSPQTERSQYSSEKPPAPHLQPTSDALASLISQLTIFFEGCRANGDRMIFGQLKNIAARTTLPPGGSHSLLLKKYQSFLNSKSGLDQHKLRLQSFLNSKSRLDQHKLRSLLSTQVTSRSGSVSDDCRELEVATESSNPKLQGTTTSDDGSPPDRELHSADELLRLVWELAMMTLSHMFDVLET